MSAESHLEDMLYALGVEWHGERLPKNQGSLEAVKLRIVHPQIPFSRTFKRALRVVKPRRVKHDSREQVTTVVVNLRRDKNWMTAARSIMTRFLSRLMQLLRNERAAAIQKARRQHPRHHVRCYPGMVYVPARVPVLVRR